MHISAVQYQSHISFIAHIWQRAAHITVVRVPTVMEKHGKAWEKILSWKVMEKSWEMGEKNKVMEIQKGHGKVMEFLHCL